MFSKKIKVSLISLICCSYSLLFSEVFFSGIAGGKIKITPDNSEDTLKPAMSAQGFFASQANFSQNIWSRMSFSVDTQNLISTAPFAKTESLFQIDELSLTFRHKIDSLSNYFSVFMGSYDPVGSDIFLQRQFGIRPITSKITETWLGTNSKLIYPQSGIGLCNIVRFKAPVATGIYAYVNHEDPNYYVVNADVRVGGTQRYITYDFATGVGAPVATKKYDDILLSVEKINWHAGTTILFGNNYTFSTFFQTGLEKGLFSTSDDNQLLDFDNLFLLIEPRIMGRDIKTHITLFNFPEKTSSNLFYVKGKLGLSANVFTDKLSSRNSGFDYGVNVSFSFQNISLTNMNDIPNAFENSEYSILFTPSVSAKISKGEFNSMLSINFMAFINSNLGTPIQLNLAYKTNF
ncbi:MAG: hypothetical protein MJ182_07815 [Treponema sp.]|nr:hypothetical protein [Treponema sp.]